MSLCEVQICSNLKHLVIEQKAAAAAVLSRRRLTFQTFLRFDRFNLKYSPAGESRLREIFLKTDNVLVSQSQNQTKHYLAFYIPAAAVCATVFVFITSPHNTSSSYLCFIEWTVPCRIDEANDG